MAVKVCQLRRKHKSRVSENRVLRRIFGSKRDIIAVGCRTLYNEEFHSLCFHQRLLE